MLSRINEMKAIVTDAIFSGFTSRADKSIGFRGVTPELTSVEKAALMDIHGINVRLLIEPKDFELDAKLEIKGQFDKKTASQRLRAVLFILWKQSSGQGEFEDFYRREMESVIEQIKSRLSDNG